MDWAGAIERNIGPLRGIVATIFAMLGLGSADAPSRISISLHRAVLRLLHPAESAVRRLIVIAARGLVVKLAPPRPMLVRPVSKGKPRGTSFQLFDPRKNFNRRRRRKGKRLIPRIHIFGCDPTVAAIWQSQRPSPPPPPAPDGLINSARLTRRLQAITSALENLPRQALRLARRRLRREKVQSLKFKSPLRPGPPPGHRKKKTHDVDEILTECQWLAHEALKPDTS